MSKLSDRLNDYQTQMSIYAEQHKIILANDVLDMIEQLQEDLEDYIKKVVAELACNSRFIDDINEHNIKCISCVIGQKTAIDIVRKGGVE